MTTSVDLALRQSPALHSLEHNTRSISKFLGPPPNLLLSEACKYGTVGLLDLIWSSSCTNVQDRTPGWSLTNYLRSDPYYYRWQFSKALYVAAERGDMEIVEWLFAHFKGCEAPFKVVEAATLGGHRHVLPFFWEHRSVQVGVDGSYTSPTDEVAQNSDFPIQGDLASTVQFGDLFCAERWGQWAFVKAVENGQLKECLDHGMPLGSYNRQIAIIHALSIGQREFAEKLLPEGSNILEYGYRCPQSDIIEKMVASGCVQWDEEYAVLALRNLAKNGGVELMEQVFQLHSPLREDDKLWKDAWWEAFTEACSNGKLDVVEWLMGHSLSHALGEKMEYGFRCCWHPLVEPIKRGHIEVLQYLYEHELFPDIHFCSAQYVFGDSPLASFEWLADHIWVDHPEQFRYATAVAVEYGRMELLDFLQSLDNPQGYEAVGNQRRRTGPVFSWSVDLLYYAARGGHVNVLQWLQENRPEESMANDSDIMDIVNYCGHLDAAKWLHANRPEGCGSSSIYRPTQHGHFEMVKWLYEIRPESRTCAALAQAIRFGHLRIAYWLRKKFPDELVTEYSVDDEKRLVRGHWESSNALDALHFLRAIYPGVFTPRFLRILRKDYSSDYYKQHTSDLILGWLDENYPSAAETTD